MNDPRVTSPYGPGLRKHHRQTAVRRSVMGRVRYVAVFRTEAEAAKASKRVKAFAKALRLVAEYACGGELTGSSLVADAGYALELYGAMGPAERKLALSLVVPVVCPGVLRGSGHPEEGNYRWEWGPAVAVCRRPRRAATGQGELFDESSA